MLQQLFAFQFCNTFGSFYYLAFISEFMLGVECESADGCIGNIAKNLAIIYISYLIVGNFLELFTAWFTHRRLAHYIITLLHTYVITFTICDCQLCCIRYCSVYHIHHGIRASVITYSHSLSNLQLML
jgi:Calcium-activated chloride channel